MLSTADSFSGHTHPNSAKTFSNSRVDHIHVVDMIYPIVLPLKMCSDACLAAGPHPTMCQMQYKLSSSLCYKHLCYCYVTFSNSSFNSLHYAEHHICLCHSTAATTWNECLLFAKSKGFCESWWEWVVECISLWSSQGGLPGSPHKGCKIHKNHQGWHRGC